jgi:hypothetical protein
MYEVCETCPFWTLIRGKHPQSEEYIDRWDCSIAVLPLLILEGAQQTRQAGAAIESFRNEMVEANQATIAVMNGQKRLTR